MDTKPKKYSRLNALRQKIGDANPTKDTAGKSSDQLALERLFTKPNRANLIAVLRASTRPQAHALANRLSQCRPGRGTRCNLSICPSCGVLIQRREKVRMWRAIIAHNNGVMPSRDQISYVTIDGFPVPTLDPVKVNKAKNSFKASVKNCRDRYLNDTAMVGLTDMGMGGAGAIHGHMLVLHPGRTRADVRSQLQLVFRGDRAVCVSEWHPDTKKFHDRTRKLVEAGTITLDQANFDNVTHYIAKIGIKPPRQRDNAGGYRVAVTVDAYADRLIKLVAMRGKGFLGSRIKLGLVIPKGTWWKRSDWFVPVDGKRDQGRNLATRWLSSIGEVWLKFGRYGIIEVLKGLYSGAKSDEELKVIRDKRLSKMLEKSFKGCRSGH